MIAVDGSIGENRKIFVSRQVDQSPEGYFVGLLLNRIAWPAACILWMVLSGCSVRQSAAPNITTENTAAAASPDPAVTNTAPPTVTPSQPVVVDWWFNAGSAEHDGFWRKFADEYTALHPHVIIRVESLIDGVRWEISKTSGESGGLPDVFEGSGGFDFYEYAKQGLLKDITADLDADGGAWRSTFGPGTLGVFSYKGKQYGVPTHMSIFGWWYNRALFRQAGISAPPASWGEFLQDVEKLRATGITPIALGEGDRWPGEHLWAYLATRIGGREAFEGAVYRTGSFSDAPFIEAGWKVRELAALEPFPADYLTATYGDQEAAMGNGQAAMELMGEWAPSVMKNNSADGMGIGEDLGWFPFPTVAGGAGGVHDVLGGGSGFWISKSAPPEAVDFLKYLTRAESQKQLAATFNFSGLPVVKGGEAGLTDPLDILLQREIAAAEYFQLYYETVLPLEMESVLLDSVQGLLDGTLTPEEAAQAIENAAAASLG
jgi:raffinose/stachyose/melibiose transport system substrate-binding protein